jgi:hypothetical protein
MNGELKWIYTKRCEETDINSLKYEITFSGLQYSTRLRFFITEWNTGDRDPEALSEKPLVGEYLALNVNRICKLEAI